MGFSIKFTDHCWRGDGALLLFGEIVFSDVTESFASAVDPGPEWTKCDYERQWRDGLTRIIDGEAKSCPITSLPDPGQTDFLVFWPMYRVRDWAVFQEKWRLPKGFPCGFDPAKPYQIVEDWISISGTGDKISEWWMPCDDVIDFRHNSP